MATTIVNSDLRVNGDLSAETMTVPASAVTNASVSSSAEISASKLQLMHKAGTAFGFVIGGTPTTREEIVYICTQPNGATVSAFHATLNDTGTSTNITYDLKKNGSSILTGAVSFTHSDSDKTIKDGSISSASLADGDILSILMTVTSSTGAQGPYAFAEVKEVPE